MKGRYLQKKFNLTGVIDKACLRCKTIEKCQDISIFCTKFKPVFKIRKCILRRCNKR